MEPEVFDTFFHQKNFIFDISRLLKQKKLFTSRYFYRLMYLMIKKPVFGKAFIKYLKDKKNWKNATSL